VARLWPVLTASLSSPGEPSDGAASPGVATAPHRSPPVWRVTASTSSSSSAMLRMLRRTRHISEVRADVIRQLHERPDGQEMADLLIFLEEWEWARQRMIEQLSRA